jgi:predicted Fe-Mo cluster-binding NifX family protein
VFDTAASILIVEVEDGKQGGRSRLDLRRAGLSQRASGVADSGVDVLICGAISRALETALASRGVRVIAHVCGRVNDVLDAYLGDRLNDSAFLMPGCCGRRRRLRCRERGGRQKDNV